MKNFLFEIVSGEYEGEEFFVQCEYKSDAFEIAREIADGAKIRFLGTYSDEEAEMRGYDTY